MSVSPMPRQVGTRIPRVEDGRYLHGRGSYVGDLPRVPKTLDVCFVRSRLAHARIKRVTGPAGLDARLLWTAAQLGDLNGLSAVSSLPGYQNHVQPLIASEVVRYVGEIVAVALGESRHAAEDLAGQVLVDVEPLPAVITIAEAIATGAPLANDSIADNVFHRETIAAGDLDAARRRASVVFTERFETSRCSGVPLEPRGALACWDDDRERLTIWTSTQVPHLLRSQLAVCLGLPERSIRVVAPDVGGGFGIKASLYPEDVLISALAIRLRRPVRWLSDRREDLIASWFAREHTYEVEAYAASDGKLLGLRVVVAANVGAYAPVPWTAAMEATMAAAVLPGPYKLVNYRADVLSVCSNTTVLGPYRGVGRPGACFVMERVMDELAHRLGITPVEIRLRNMVRHDEFPYRNAAGLLHDSGSFEQALQTAADAIGLDDFRRRQAQARDQGRYLGVGFANYTEETAHGTPEWLKSGLPITLSYESADMSMDPSGEVTVRVGAHSQGQGHETTLAQVAGDALGIDAGKVRIVYGDTDSCPYGIGTFASRSAVATGAAINDAATLIREKLRRIAAEELEAAFEDLELIHEGFRVKGTHREITIRELAAIAYHRVDRLPEGERPGLHVVSYLEVEPSTGTFSNAAHAAIVEVDPDTGGVEILDYVVVEDCGKMINPTVVDGQIHGGTAQGIGMALLEEIAYTPDGQPLTTTLGEYLLPSSNDVPMIRTLHIETPSDTALGLKGVGESGTIAPPGAIGNAIADALRPLQARINRTPMKPSTVWEAIPRDVA